MYWSKPFQEKPLSVQWIILIGRTQSYKNPVSKRLFFIVFIAESSITAAEKTDDSNFRLPSKRRPTVFVSSARAARLFFLRLRVMFCMCSANEFQPHKKDMATFNREMYMCTACCIIPRRSRCMFLQQQLPSFSFQDVFCVRSLLATKKLCRVEVSGPLIIWFYSSPVYVLVRQMEYGNSAWRRHATTASKGGRGGESENESLCGALNLPPSEILMIKGMDLGHFQIWVAA